MSRRDTLNGGKRKDPLSSENPELSKTPCFMPGVGRNVVLHAWLVSENSSFLMSSYTGSFSFRAQRFPP